MISHTTERGLLLAPFGRDAALAASLLAEHNIGAKICPSLGDLVDELERNAGLAIIAEEVLREGDLRALSDWIARQPEWSDFPFVVLSRHGGAEQTAAVGRMLQILGNVTFVERPFHPTTLISLAEAALRARRRQYQARASLKKLHQLNETLEMRVAKAIEDQRQAEIALRHAQKMEAVGQLTGGVAHDFNNLLMVISAGLNILDRHGTDEGRVNLAKQGMRQAIERGTGLSRQLLAFSRRRAFESQVVDLGQHLFAMRELLGRTMGDSTLALNCSDGVWPVEVDSGELELAILNLCVNARDAMPNGGQISIHVSNEVRTKDGVSNDVVSLSIADTGVGIPQDVLPRVFEPFYTTKDVGKGSGLGLAQVYAFMSQSLGEVVVDSVVGKGTKVTLIFPRSQKLPDSNIRKCTVASVVPQPRRAHVLLVEDDESVSAVTSDMLETLGHRVTYVSTPQAALEILSNGHGIDIVLSDVMMPGGVNGVELACEIRRRWPNTPVVLATGYVEAARSAIKEGMDVLIKPYELDALSRALANSSKVGRKASAGH